MGHAGSSLHESIKKENTRSVRKKVKKHSADINQKVHDRTVLFNAAKENNRELIDILLEYGAKPNIICSVTRRTGFRFQWSVMHEASRQNNVELLESLISHGGDVNLCAHEELTPLHVAAWHGHRESVQQLIERGADVNQLDTFKESPIVIPICNGDKEVVELLLNAGCKLNTRAWGNLSIRTSRHVAAFRNKEGPFSLLSLAIMFGNFDVATLLLQHGYNPNKYELYVFLKIIKNSVGNIDEDGKRLIECYIAAGYRQKCSDEKVMLDNLLLPPNYGFDKDTIDWVKNQIGCPSLKDLARMSIRAAVQQHLHEGSVYHELNKLPLPDILKRYVRLDDYEYFSGSASATFAVPQQCVCCLERFTTSPSGSQIDESETDALS